MVGRLQQFAGGGLAPLVGRSFLRRSDSHWRRLGAIGLALTAFVTLACHDQECDAARLELTQTWETLRATATSRQQIPEGAELSKLEENERIRLWKSIESKADLIRSSFETKQVTWPSADKARRELGAIFTPLESQNDPMTRGFAVTLAEADKRMAAFRGQCR
jgi:hypothetical protein